MPNKQKIYTAASHNVAEWNIDFHNIMLNDTIRMNTYKKAIFDAIKPGMIVCEIGVGTGILSKWALEAGAKKVYGIEMNKEIIIIAKKRLSKFGDKFIPLHEISYNINLPEKVDIIISEILGNIMDNEDCVPILCDAKKRFLKKNGIMLPQKVSSFIIPVDHNISHKDIKMTHINNLSFDKHKNLYNREPYNFYYDTLIDSSQYLSNKKHLSLMSRDIYQEFYKKEISFKIEHSGLFTGFKGWFHAQLSENFSLNIESYKKHSTSWKHIYFPIKNTFQVEKGDTINLVFERSYSNKYSWQGSICRGGVVVGTYKHSMN